MATHPPTTSYTYRSPSTHRQRRPSAHATTYHTDQQTHHTSTLAPPSKRSHAVRPSTSPTAPSKLLSHITTATTTTHQITPDTILAHLGIELTEATQRAHTSHSRRQNTVSNRPTTSSRQRSDAIKRSWLIGSAVQHYTVGKTIGEGTFGKVKRGVHKLTGCAVAIKILEKDRISDVSDIERVKREICILCRVRHMNCVQLYQVIDSPKHIFLIMEYCAGGELFDYIVQQGRVEEMHACTLFHHIINGVAHCHTIDVIHRDLKPENLLLTDAYSGAVKIVDFGLSNTAEHGRMLKTACGSPCYAAPEMIKGQRYVGSCVDIWSCGVILYALLCGYLPFEDSNTAKLYDKIINGEYVMPDHVSPYARDLVGKLLTTDPMKRHTVHQIRQHRWYQQCTVETDDVTQSVMPGVHVALDSEVLSYMSGMQYDSANVTASVQLNKYNHDSATYDLLCLAKRQNNGVLMIQAAAAQPVYTDAEVLSFEVQATAPAATRQASSHSHASSRRHSGGSSTTPQQPKYTIPVPPVKLAAITTATTAHHSQHQQQPVSYAHSTRIDYVSPYINAGRPVRPQSHGAAHRTVLSPRKSVTNPVRVQPAVFDENSEIHVSRVSSAQQRRPTTSSRYTPMPLNVHNIAPVLDQPSHIVVPVRPPTAARKPPVPRQAVRRHSAKNGGARVSSAHTVVLADISHASYNKENYSGSNVNGNTHKLYTLHNAVNKQPANHNNNGGGEYFQGLKLPGGGETSYKYASSKPVTASHAYNMYSLTYNR